MTSYLVASRLIVVNERVVDNVSRILYLVET